MENHPHSETDRKLQLSLSSLLAILTFSSIRDAILLTRYRVPVGVDGYYYVVQVRSLLEKSVLYYPTKTPVVLGMISVVARLCGNPIVAAKLTSILLHAALTSALFVLISSITRSRWLGLLASVVSVISVAHLTWIGEFINQLGGITFALWAAACLAPNPTSKSRQVLAAILLLAAFFSHKSMIFLVLTFLILVLILWLVLKVWPSRFPLLRLGVVVGVLTCLPLIALHCGSLGKQVTDSVSLLPRLPVTLAGFEEQVALMFLAPLGLFLVVRQSPSPGIGRYAIGATALFAILFTLNPFLNHEGNLTTISERLDLLAYQQLAVLLPGVVWLMRTRVAALIISLCVVSLLLLGNKTLPIGIQPGFLERRETLLGDLTRAQPKIPDGSIIIAPHGDQFLVTFATGAKSQSKVPTANRAQEVFWLVLGAPCRTSEGLEILSDRGVCSILVTENLPLFVTDFEKRQVLSMNPHLRNAPVQIIDHLLVVRPRN
jgi:hypothetical protein